MCNKISRSLYAIRTAKNFLTGTALKSLYFALVHSLIIYGLHIWGGSANKYVNEVVILQKKAIRIICDAKYNAHTEPLFKSQKILPFNDLFSFFKLLFMYDYINNLLPSSFSNVWPSNEARRLHHPAAGQNVNLRNDSLLSIPFIRLQSHMNFPLAEFPRIWNDFHQVDITSTPSRPLFKKLLKEYFFSKLDENYKCTRLLCLSCNLQI